MNREKISFSSIDFVDYEILILGLTSLTGFYETAHFCSKNDTCQIVKRKSLLFEQQHT